MKYFLRSGAEAGKIGKGLVAAAALGLLLVAGAQAGALKQFPGVGEALLLGSSQGYLGVELGDVDAQKAQTLKLKEVRGALITLIDHDAPAGKVGLKVNDVVVQVNGQAVEGAEQMRRILREIPAGRKVSLSICRDGNVQTLTVEMADRKVVEHDAWNKIDQGSDLFAAGPGMAMLAGGKGGGNAPASNGWHLPFFGGGPNVGVLVEPLNGQMAEVLGVKSGLMVKQVTRRSAAAAAGLKALDVILKVGSEPVTKLSGWERAMRANEGKTVSVTILRDKKQQTVTLQVDSKRHG
ncbi:MAG: PDZ domain-containing protein [Terracidiphilus sp.]|nr:PDZ domain-containing protein [Terracidiphilus sp.]